jgi:hypothetical protein
MNFVVKKTCNEQIVAIPYSRLYLDSVPSKYTLKYFAYEFEFYVKINKKNKVLKREM